MSNRLLGKTIAQIRNLAREDAENILDLHWQHRSIPVDPVKIARSLGVSVFADELGDEVFGMLVGSNGDVNMYLDRSQPPNRFRFTCAHEIGHLIDRGEDLALGGAILDYRNGDGRGRADEIYANEFAGSLLMPEIEFRELLEADTSELVMAETFDVSLPALRYRRSKLGTLN